MKQKRNEKRTAKKSIGAEIIEGLTEFRDVLRSGEPIENSFTVRTVELDLKPLKPKQHDARSVRMTRQSLNVSQALFAQLLGVSIDLVQAWEQGARTPKPIACHVLDDINRNKSYWIDRLQKAARPARRAPHGSLATRKTA
jgi:putative transcriptional regulator